MTRRPLLIPLHEIRDKILQEIKPSDEENAKIDLIISEITYTISNWNNNHDRHPIVEILPQGSTGIKQTHLKHAADIDLFILLDPEIYKDTIWDKKNKVDRKSLAKLFKNYCKSWIIPALESAGHKNVILSYAEHPYVSSRYKNYEIDVVFAFLLKKDFLFENGPITAVDRTYYHSKFVESNLSDEQHDDVRLLKKFFKNQFSYGDKAPIGRGGFIGYAAELMIHQFGSIDNLFDHFHDLPNIAVDVYDRDEITLRKRTRLQNDFLVIMDPTDKERNVASSISARAWIYCRDVIKKLSNNLDISYFLEPTIPELSFDSEEAHQNYIIAHFKQKTDDHYTKIRDKLYSMADSIVDSATTEQDGTERFPVVNYAILFNPPAKDFYISFYTSKMEISERYARRGPPLNDMRNLSKFVKKHPDYEKKNGFAWIPKQRDFSNFLVFLKDQVDQLIFSEVETITIRKISNYKKDDALHCCSILKHCVIPFQDELSEWLARKLHIKKKQYRK